MLIKFKISSQFIILLSAIVCLFLISTNIHADKNELLDTYKSIKSSLENNAYGIPIYINSNNENRAMVGEVFGTLPYAFSELKQVLTKPENWCDIAPQHLNIKACTYQRKSDFCEITFYTGRKFYESPEDAYKLQYRYSELSNTSDHFHISFTAASGPMGTKDYKIEAEAIPLNEKISFIRFSYAYKYNYLTELGMDTYLATLGSGKVGFSVTGKNSEGQPNYIEGVRGIIERNSVRYYLAIQSYLETQNIPSEKRYMARITKWFDLTEKHHRQLFEMEKADYLKYKQFENQDQIKLQAEINKNSNNHNNCSE